MFSFSAHSILDDKNISLDTSEKRVRGVNVYHKSKMFIILATHLKKMCWKTKSCFSFFAYFRNIPRVLIYIRRVYGEGVWGFTDIRILIRTVPAPCLSSLPVHFPYYSSKIDPSMFRSSRLVSKYFRTVSVTAPRSTHPYPFSIISVVRGRKRAGYGYRTPHFGLWSRHHGLRTGKKICLLFFNRILGVPGLWSFGANLGPVYLPYLYKVRS